MKKILTSNVKFMMGMIVGILASSITVYAAYNYIASEVSYSPSDKNWKVDSVEEALNELHNQYKDMGSGYGIKRALNATSSAWTRVGASVGLEANAQIGTTPVKNDFDTIYPWSDIISYNYDTDTKQIIAYYGEENFTFTPIGNIEVLTKIPEFYYRRYQDDEYEYIFISKNKQEGYTKSETFSVGRYTMSGNSTRVHSRSGVAPLANTTITNFRNYARNLGTEFSQLDYHYFILQLLYLVEYADYNSQIKLGLGNIGSVGSSVPHNSGSCDSLGMKSGSVNGSNTSSIIYRGIEDIYGNIWQFIDGINIQNNQTYICYDKNQYEVDKYDGCYQPIGYVNASQTGYIARLGYDEENPLIAFPVQVGGSDYTYITDAIHSGGNCNKIIRMGGDWYSNSLESGLFNWYTADNSSISDRTISSRLLKLDT